MTRRTYETTDGRFIMVGKDQWWDTTGIDFVSESVVDKHMELHRVGIVVLRSG